MMRQVWRYALFGLGVIGVIWGIVMLFSQVWQAVIAFVLALACFVATRLVAREEISTQGAVPEVGPGNQAITNHEPPQPTDANVSQQHEPTSHGDEVHQDNQGHEGDEVVAELEAEAPVDQSDVDGEGETYVANSEVKRTLAEAPPLPRDTGTDDW